MALQIKSSKSIVKEDIVDEEGNVLGQLVFDPENPTIMEKLTKIVYDLSETGKKFDSVDLDENKIKESINSGNLEEQGKVFKELNDLFKLEYEYNKKALDDLKEIFGENIINIVTCNTNSLERAMPIIEFVIPYVQEYRKKKTDSYISNNKHTEIF